MNEGRRRFLESELRKEFPNGHPDFIDLSLDDMDLHNRKNKDYAAGGDPLGNFKRVAHMLESYPGLDLTNPAVVALVYSLKQFDAVLWMLCKGYEGNVESRDERLADISVYAKIAQLLLREQERGENGHP